MPDGKSAWFVTGAIPDHQFIFAIQTISAIFVVLNSAPVFATERAAHFFLI